MKRNLKVAYIVLALVVGVAAPALAYAYSATFVIQNTTTTDYEMLAVMVDSPNEWMADNGFMEDDAQDTRVETYGGTARAHMVAEDKTLAASVVPGESQVNLYFTTGNDDDTMSCVAGYDGYMMFDDAAALELGNDFEIHQIGYFITTPPYGIFLFKEDAVIVYAQAAGVIRLSILGAATETVPTGFDDYDAAWANEANAYDNNNGTGADLTSAAGGDSWSSYLGFTIGATECYGLLVSAETDADWTLIDIDAYYDSAWNDVYQGPYTNTTATRYHFLSRELESVTEFRVRFFNDNAGAQTENALLREVDLLVLNETVWAAITASNGETWMEYYHTGGSLHIDNNTDGLSGVTITAAAVPNNAYDYYVMGNKLPSMSYFEMEIPEGTNVLEYEPDDMIVNTGEAGTADSGTANTIVDAVLTQANDYWNGARLMIVTTTDTLAPQGETSIIYDFVAGTDTLYFNALSAAVDTGDTYTVDFGTMPDNVVATVEDARITWGYMPTDVTVTLGSMASQDQATAGEAQAIPTPDVMPAVDSSDWFQEPAVGAALATHPLRPLVTIMSDTTTITEIQSWRILGLAFVLFVTVLAAKYVRNHLFIAGCAAGASTGIMVALTIFPMWALVFAIGAIAAGVVAERSPSL